MRNYARLSMCEKNNRRRITISVSLATYKNDKC